MSLRHQAGINLPGYNALKVANAPTIGTATQVSSTSVSVAFTAPSCVGGGAITSYTAFACCGVKTGTGASSPLTVTGLTTCQSYTFKVFATNAYGPSFPSGSSNSVTLLATSQQAYTTAGTYSWVVPAGVTSISAIVVGGGGAGGGVGSGSYSFSAGNGAGGGALSYTNNISVTPGETLTVTVGAGGVGSVGLAGTAGGNSSLNRSATVILRAVGGSGGLPADNTATAAGGAAASGVGSTRYSGGSGSARDIATVRPGAGGGAAGYGGNGGNGVTSANGQNGNGGGGGGASTSQNESGGGGGVGLLGQGANGVGGTYIASGLTNSFGGGGSGGANGTRANPGVGGAYGGGGGGGFQLNSSGGTGGVGAVRIIWPGTTRSFPSTNTGNL